MMAMMAMVLHPMMVAPQRRISAGTIHIVCVCSEQMFHDFSAPIQDEVKQTQCQDSDRECERVQEK